MNYPAGFVKHAKENSPISNK